MSNLCEKMMCCFKNDDSAAQNSNKNAANENGQVPKENGNAVGNGTAVTTQPQPSRESQGPPEGTEVPHRGHDAISTIEEETNEQNENGNFESENNPSTANAEEQSKETPVYVASSQVTVDSTDHVEPHGAIQHSEDSETEHSENKTFSEELIPNSRKKSDPLTLLMNHKSFTSIKESDGGVEPELLPIAFERQVSQLVDSIIRDACTSAFPISKPSRPKSVVVGSFTARLGTSATRSSRDEINGNTIIVEAEFPTATERNVTKTVPRQHSAAT